MMIDVRPRIVLVLMVETQDEKDEEELATDKHRSTQINQDGK
jgi:hypothetical protein